MADSFDFKISDVLRSLRPEGAPGGMPLPTKQGAVPEKSFKDVLSDKINEVNSLLLQKDRAVEALATGKTENVAEVLTAVEKADIAFKALMQIRNKLVEAYKEVERMQV
jgi:flagellar hook-basal body complex protein FliE